MKPPRNDTAIGGALIGLGLLAAGPGPLAAQAHIGLTGGITYADLSGSFVESAGGAYGAIAGLNVEQWFGTEWVLDAELLVFQKGASDVPFEGELLDYHENWIEIPVMLNRVFPIGGGWGVSPFAGLSIGLNLSCGFRSEGEFGYTDCEETTPGGTPQSTDVSIPFGVALRRWYPGGAKFSVDIRYWLGVNNSLEPDDTSARNRAFVVTFGFGFPLSGVTP